MNDENENNGAPEQEQTSQPEQPVAQAELPTESPEAASQPEESPAQPTPPEETVTVVVTGDVSETAQFPAGTSLKDVIKKMKVPATSQLRASTGIITDKSLSVGQIGRDAQGNVAISVTKKTSGG